MTDDDVLSRALACIPPERLAKAAAARLRYERRQERLRRMASERKQQRHALLHDPIAQALAKANAVASRAYDEDR